jgi:DnaJ-class molecular chaperone
MIVWAVRVAHKRVRRQISCPCTACGTTGRNGKGGQCGDCNGTGRVDKWITEIVEE